MVTWEISKSELGHNEKLDRCVDCNKYDRKLEICLFEDLFRSPFDIACEYFDNENPQVEKLKEMVE